MLSFVSISHLFRNVNKCFIFVHCCHAVLKTHLNLQRGVATTEHLYLLQNVCTFLERTEFIL